MTTLPEQKLDVLLNRHAVVQAELSQQLAPDAFVKLSREFAEIDPVVEKIKAYREVAAELADLEALIADPSTDPAMRQMADDERHTLNDKRERIVEELRLALLPKDAMDERNVIVEIRAGTGGDSGSKRSATRLLPRSAANMNCTRSLEPTERKSTRGISESSWNNSDGTSTMAPTSTRSGSLWRRRRNDVNSRSISSLASSNSAQFAIIGNITFSSRPAAACSSARIWLRIRPGRSRPRRMARQPSAGFSSGSARI